jgi:hypothetical protein
MLTAPAARTTDTSRTAPLTPPNPQGEIDAELEEELEAQIAIEKLRCQLPAEGDGACPKGIQGQVSAASANSAFGRNSA